MKPKTQETGTSYKPTIKDRLSGRSLRIPGVNGGLTSIRVNTLRLNVFGDMQDGKPRNRRRQLVFLGDYNDQDARSRVRQALAREVPERRIRETIDVDVDKFATLSGSYELAENTIFGIDPSKTIVYYNIAPRGADNGNEGNHLSVKWQGEERQGLIFAITTNGVPIIGVNSGYNFSLLKGNLARAWKVDFSHDEQLQRRLNDTQFRSLEVYPHALEILRGTRRGRRFFGEELDIANDIPDAPEIIKEDEGRQITTRLLYIDGRDSKTAGYHNLKLLLRESDLTDAIRTSKKLSITINGVMHEYTNTFAFVPNEKPHVQAGEFFLARGSSGDPSDHWLEANQMYAPAADAFGLERVTDETSVIIRAIE